MPESFKQMHSEMRVTRSLLLWKNEMYRQAFTKLSVFLYINHFPRRKANFLAFSKYRPEKSHTVNFLRSVQPRPMWRCDCFSLNINQLLFYLVGSSKACYLGNRRYNLRRPLNSYHKTSFLLLRLITADRWNRVNIPLRLIRVTIKRKRLIIICSGTPQP